MVNVTHAQAAAQASAYVHGTVIAASPASTPFKAMLKSHLPCLNFIKNKAVRAAVAAARLGLTAIT